MAPEAARAAVAEMPDPFVLVTMGDDGVWRLSYVNPAHEAVTGYTADEVIGMAPGKLLGPLSDPDMVDDAFAAAEHGLVRRRIVLHHRDGSPLWCELRGGFLAGEPGEPRHAWAQLIIEETGDGSRFRRLLENVSDTVAVLDADGIIRYVSPAVTTLTGALPSEVMETSIFDFLDPANVHLQREFWERVLAIPGVHGPVIVRLCGPRGAVVPVEVVLNNRLDDAEVHGIVVTARDITERQAAEQVAAQMERRLQALVQHASDIVIVLDGEGRLTYLSPAVERLLGVGPDDLDPAGHNGRVFELFHPDDLPKALTSIAARLDIPGYAGVIEARLRHREGGWTWFELVATNLLDDPDVAGIVLNGRDISERKRTERLMAGELSVLETMAGSQTLMPVLRRLAEVAETFFPGSACTIGVMDDDGVIRHPAAPSLPAAVVSGLDAETPESALGRLVRGGVDRVISRDIANDTRWGALGQVVLDHGYRSCWWVLVEGTASDDLLGVVAIFHPDVRAPRGVEIAMFDRLRHLAGLALERGRFERRLEFQAVHDGLTGLPNRTLLLDRVERALEFGRLRQTHTAVLFIDIDRFKVVNDSLGHAAGDELLRQVSTRLVDAVGPGATVGRFGGDEFVVVAEDVGGEAGALAAAERLLAAFDEDVELFDQAVRVSASIGVALAGIDTEDVGADAMIRNADAAMYRAKDAGRARVSLFEETLHAEAVRRYELEQGLRAALAHEEFIVLYQPRVRLTDGRVIGVEALLRWDRPGYGRVPAGDVIPIAEETGLIVPIGTWVLDTACAQAVAWDDDPVTAGLTMSVNLSARQLGDPGIVETVAWTLAKNNLAAERLCLEVTESALAADIDAAASVLNSLKGLGVQLAIDDFGTGYATLDYVRRFSMADELKIDRSFVAGIADLQSPDAAIVSAAIVLADALGFEVVAEGVETADQLAVLRRLGCRAAQGYFFGRPVPPDELA